MAPPGSVPARLDLNQLLSKDVLRNLLTHEKRHAASSTYFATVQTEVQPYMRPLLVAWMTDVCREVNADYGVLPLACSLLDRFLSKVAVHKTQLQTLGSACLFIASKERQTQPIPSRSLVEFTDYAVTLDELLSWELLVLGRLNWDIAGVTSIDIVHHLLAMLALPYPLTAALAKHAAANCGCICKEFTFSLLPSSRIAVALLLDGWSCFIDETSTYDVISALATILGVETSTLIAETTPALAFFKGNRPKTLPSPSPGGATPTQFDESRKTSKAPPCQDNRLTPADVDDVIA